MTSELAIDYGRAFFDELDGVTESPHGRISGHNALFSRSAWTYAGPEMVGEMPLELKEKLGDKFSGVNISIRTNLKPEGVEYNLVLQPLSNQKDQTLYLNSKPWVVIQNLEGETISEISDEGLLDIASDWALKVLRLNKEHAVI